MKLQNILLEKHFHSKAFSSELENTSFSLDTLEKYWWGIGLK